MDKEQIEKLEKMAFEIRESEDYIYYIFAYGGLYQDICHYVRVSKDSNIVIADYKNKKTLYEATNLYSPKLEPVKVPLTKEDIIKRVNERKPIFVKLINPPASNEIDDDDYDSIDAIYSFSDNGVYTPTTRYSYYELAEHFVFIDGDPCYKLEGGE